ncbi:MAG: glycosyltransferase, partial [Phycisphaeraceae bacterium]|nr:glycosyltransferase [Phycisphaeraceae bacterium]
GPGSLVFTPPARLRGRSLAGRDDDSSARWHPDAAAAAADRFGVGAQHRIDRTAAHAAEVFTTVSTVTANECEHLLGRRPDRLLPNGLNIERFTALHEFQNLHREFKDRIHRFTIGHFFPSYSFDLDRTLYFFTSGRFEPRNKGMDVTVEALARLNARLRRVEDPPTIVAFIVTKRPYHSINVRALHNSSMLEEFATISDAVKDQVGQKLFESTTAGKIPDLDALVDEYWMLRLRRAIQAFKSDLLPGIVTHDLSDDERDPVLNQLRQCQLWNQRHDPVKVIYHPDFIDSTNPLLGLEYDQFVRGCHLGIFPSYYEPWGYTPLESIALGVPAVTSNLSGFGAYLLENVEPEDREGLCILERTGDFHAEAEQLADHLFAFAQTSRRERIATRNKVESFSPRFDWSRLVEHYQDAHDLAIDRVYG